MRNMLYHFTGINLTNRVVRAVTGDSVRDLGLLAGECSESLLDSSAPRSEGVQHIRSGHVWVGETKLLEVEARAER